MLLILEYSNASIIKMHGGFNCSNVQKLYLRLCLYYVPSSSVVSAGYVWRILFVNLEVDSNEDEDGDEDGWE